MTGIASRAVGADEIAVLKRLGLDGAIDGEIKLSCAGLADALSTSTQTASRRLQALDEAELIRRETVSDGQWVSVTAAGERLLHGEYESYRRLFDAGRSLTIGGTVTGGMGEGRHYISLSGYMQQFETRLGYAPFPGTLNIDLTAGGARKRGALDSFDSIPIDEWADDDRTYGAALCYPATISNDAGERFKDAHVITPERTHHDDDHLEVIAPERLRDTLSLDDDDQVVIEVREDA